MLVAQTVIKGAALFCYKIVHTKILNLTTTPEKRLLPFGSFDL